MAYEFKKADVYDFANMFSGQKLEKGNELYFDYCPYCKGGGHDKKTFSINLDNGTFNCFRASCGKHGHFVELARDFNFKLDFGETKQYRHLPQKPIEVRSKAVEYLLSRGISESTTKKYKITTHKEHNNILVFPFYDPSGMLTMVKYRKTDFNPKKDRSKEWCEKNTQPILFGMAQCEDFTTLVITEGQIDSLSVAECGIKNAVSVPHGANGFTWVPNCIDWLEKFQEIIVFGDFENGKITLADEIQKRTTQKIRVVRKEDYLGEKDANDILRRHGKENIIKAVKNAEVPKSKNIKDLSEVKAINLNELPKIKTNIPEIDRIIGGLYFGQVVLLSGQRGEGKSTFMSQMIVEALEQNSNVFVYSGELADYHFKRWLDLQIAGPESISVSKNEFGDEIYSIPDKVIEKINLWYKGRAYIYDNSYIPENQDEYETLIETAEKAIRRYECKLICIDNLMTALNPEELQKNLYNAQSGFVGKLKGLAMKYNVVVVLVAHPRKSKTEFENDDVSGSADITNKVDVVMAYARAKEEDQCSSKLTIAKNRLTGKLAMGDKAVELLYSEKSKRISSYKSGKRIYGWQKDFEETDDFDAPF